MLILSCEIVNKDSIPLGYLYEQSTEDTTTSSISSGSSTTKSTTSIPSTSSTTSTFSTPISTITQTSTTSSSTEDLSGPPSPIPSSQVCSDPEGRILLLQWTHPPEADYAGVVIRYSTTAAPTDLTEGDYLVTVPVYASVNNRFQHTGLLNGTTYYYSLFAYDDTLNYATPVLLNGIPEDITPPAPITNFTYTPTNTDQFALSWENSTSVDWAGLKMRVQGSDYDSDPTASASDSNCGYDLEFFNTYPPTTSCNRCSCSPNDYYVTAWVYDADGNYSDPVYLLAFPETYESSHHTAVDLDGAVYLRWRFYNNTTCNEGTRILHSTAGYPTTFTPENPEEDNGVDDPILLSDVPHPTTNGGSTRIGFYLHEDLDNDGDPDNDGNDDITHYYTFYDYAWDKQCWSDPITLAITNKSKTNLITYEETFEDEGTHVGDVPQENIPPEFSGTWSAYDAETNCAADDDTYWGITNDPAYTVSGSKAINMTSCSTSDFGTGYYRIYRRYQNNKPRLTFDFDISDVTNSYFCYWATIHNNVVQGGSFIEVGAPSGNVTWFPDSGETPGWTVQDSDWTLYCYDLSGYAGQNNTEISFQYRDDDTSTSSCGNPTGAVSNGYAFVDDFTLVKYD